jgi:hypothetical protein
MIVEPFGKNGEGIKHVFFISGNEKISSTASILFIKTGLFAT